MTKLKNVTMVGINSSIHLCLNRCLKVYETSLYTVLQKEFNEIF